MEKKRKVTESFRFAFQGLLYVLHTQPHMRFHFITAISVLIVSMFLELTPIETVILFFTIILVLLTEMFNTAVEKLTDIQTQNPNPLAKIAKDVAAGGVLLASINAIVVAVIILLPKILRLIKKLLI